jgi:hypothetical protein
VAGGRGRKAREERGKMKPGRREERREERQWVGLKRN